MASRKAISAVAAAALLAFSVALLAAQPGAMAQEAPAEGADGRLVFSAYSGRCCEMDIYAVDVGATTAPTQLTSELGQDVSPSVSPDGSWIAWQRGGEVWKMRADGSDKTRVVADEFPEDPPQYPYPGGALDPAWSPDGSEIAFVRDGDLWAVGADGSGQRRITQGDESPAWAPDRKRMADEAPAWSPDGERLAFMRIYSFEGGGTGGWEILVADADDGSGATPISRNASGSDPHEPDWSPDGTEVAFAGWGESAAGDYQGQIFVARADGSGARRVFGGEPYDISDVVYGNPSYSPDGSRIAYTADGGLFTADPDGTDRELAYDHGSRQPLYAEDLDWVSKPPDAKAPAITAPRPAPKSSTRDRTPTVRATVRDAESNLAASDIKLYVDGDRKTFSYNLDTDRLSRTTGRLSFGRHAVRIEAEDAAGNATQRAWSFRVVRGR